MAMVGKTAGIVSGLAVGLASGVILAALNPILPRKDVTQVGTVPNVTARVVEPSEETAPKLGMVPAIAPERTPTQQVGEQVSQPEMAVTVEPQTTAPKASDVAGLKVVPDPSGEADPVLIRPQLSVSNTPQSVDQLELAQGRDAQPNISTTPAEPVMLQKPAADTASPSMADPGADPEDPAVVAPSIGQDVIAKPASQLPQTQTEQEAPAVISTSPAARPEPEKPAAVAVVEPETAPSNEERVQSEAEQATEPKPVTEPESIVEPEVHKPNTSGTFKTVGTRLPTVGQDKESVFQTIGSGGSRLKTIGNRLTDKPQDTVNSTDPSEDRAIIRNANAYESEGKPLVSFVLLGDDLALESLGDISGTGLPIAMAVSIDRPDASLKTRRFREAGFEVLAMSPQDVKLSLSGGQSDAQVADILDQFFAIMPEAIGLIDMPNGNLQKDQKLSRAILKHFAKTGHGLVTYAGGLNAVTRVAAQMNVPAAAAYKVLDANAAAVAQALNRGSREARSKGQVVLVASPNKETLGALLSWSLSRKAKPVSLAPVSAALLNGTN